MNYSYFILLLLPLLLNSQSISSKCQTFIDNWKINISSVPSIVATNSGKFLNDLGDYNNCQYHKDQFTYMTMSMLNLLTGTNQFMGICVPNICAQYLQTPQISQNISQTLNDIYHKLSKKQNSTIVKNVLLYSPVKVQPKMGVGSIVIIALIISLFAFEMLSSIILKFKFENKPTNNRKIEKVLKAFSLSHNFKKIIQVVQVQNSNLLFLNGLRVLSMCWIIFGHDQWLRFMNLKNWVDSQQILTTPGLVTFTPAAYFAVDVFFWIGGFLISIGLIQKMRNLKMNPIKFYFIAIIHRFIRVWPTYMVAILLFWKVAPFLLSGPIWSTFNHLASTCNNGGILWNMFFIDNFGDHGPSGMNYCFGWGWYLAADFQLFLITPLLFFIYNKNKKIGLFVTFLIWAASIIIAFSMIMINDWRYPIPNPRFKPQPEFMDKFYYKPYIRISTYIMGIWMGMFYLQWKSQNQKIVKIVNKVIYNTWIKTMFYILGIGLINTTIWIIIPFQKYGNWTTTAQAFYNSLDRIVFLIGVTLVCFPAMFGCKNDPVHKILGHKIFGPLAKISFCMYLVHLIVIMMGVYSNRMDLYWQPSSSIYLVISDIFWTVILAVFLSVLIEAPTLGIQKMLMSQQKLKPKVITEIGETVKTVSFQQNKQIVDQVKQSFISSQSTMEQEILKTQI